MRGCIGGTLRNSTALFQARVCERDSERDDGITQSKQTFFSLDYAKKKTKRKEGKTKKKREKKGKLDFRTLTSKYEILQSESV